MAQGVTCPTEIHRRLLIGLKGVPKLGVGLVGGLPGIALLHLGAADVAVSHIIGGFMLIIGGFLEVVTGLTTIISGLLLIVRSFSLIPLSLLPIVVALGENRDGHHKQDEEKNNFFHGFIPWSVSGATINGWLMESLLIDLQELGDSPMLEVVHILDGGAQQPSDILWLSSLDD